MNTYAKRLVSVAAASVAIVVMSPATAQADATLV
ncbi:MAG: hypothetical protein QOD39_5581, partial [Mycobacterium sp.]|nr:hypothetical protein [Mycobacterium sp.]